MPLQPRAPLLVVRLRGGLDHINVLTNTMMAGVFRLVDGRRRADRQEHGPGDGEA